MIPRFALGLSMLLVLTVLLGTVVAVGQQRRIEAVIRQRDAAESERDHALSKASTAQADVQTVTRYVDRVRVVRETGATIIKEVPAHVPPEADRACVVPAGFVRVHDAAAQNQLTAGSAGDADAIPAGIALSTVATTVTDNYTTCHAIREQLIALQQALRQREDLTRD